MSNIMLMVFQLELISTEIQLQLVTALPLEIIQSELKPLMRLKTLLKELLHLPFHKLDMVDKILVMVQMDLMVLTVLMDLMAPTEESLEMVEMEEMAQEMDQTEMDQTEMDPMVMDLMVETEVLLQTHKITQD